jgi:hypothetical protein
MAEIINIVSSIKTILLELGPDISIILIVLSGLVYGLSYTQPAKNRGKWQSIAAGILIGGIIVAAITGAAELIQRTSSTAFL